MKTTTEPESKDAKRQELAPATDKGTRSSDDFPDPDFQIDGSGGPSDGAMERGVRVFIREGDRGIAVGKVTDTLKDTPPDPWDEVDGPLSAAEAAAALAFAEADSESFRQSVLRDCVDAAEASRQTGHSVQELDRLRRDGRLIALQAGSEWYYPHWQFEANAPDGILPGLGEVLRNLYLSPVGATFWLLQPSEQLGGRPPLELLRRHQTETVVRLAEEQGYMP
jgi:hypothetical protein